MGKLNFGEKKDLLANFFVFQDIDGPPHHENKRKTIQKQKKLVFEVVFAQDTRDNRKSLFGDRNFESEISLGGKKKLLQCALSVRHAPSMPLSLKNKQQTTLRRGNFKEKRKKVFLSFTKGSNTLEAYNDCCRCNTPYLYNPRGPDILNYKKKCKKLFLRLPTYNVHVHLGLLKTKHRHNSHD